MIKCSILWWGGVGWGGRYSREVGMTQTEPVEFILKNIAKTMYNVLLV